MTDKQKDDALSFANKLAEESDEKKVNEAISKVDKFKDNKVIKGLWDNILILIEIIKSPLFQRTVSIGAIAAILYLVSPIDIIPDIILGVGLLDDAFIISTMVAGVVKNIKKDPIKAIRFIDSLPSHLKDTAAKLFGVTAGAIAGYKAGEVAGDYLKTHNIEKTLENVVKENKTLDEILFEQKNEIASLATAFLAKEMRKSIRESFKKRITKSLLVLSFRLLAVVLTLVPLFGNASKYVASFFLLTGYLLTAVLIVSALKKFIPYITSIIKQKSIIKGIEAKLLAEYEILQRGKEVLYRISEKLNINIALSAEDLKKLAKYLLKSFYQEILLYILGSAMIVIAFMAIRVGVTTSSVALTPLKLLLFPFFV